MPKTLRCGRRPTATCGTKGIRLMGMPAGTSPKVLLGQRAIAGETVLAEVGVDATLTGISQ